MSFELIARTFNTKLGTIKTSLYADNQEISERDQNSYEHGQSKLFETVGHRIELIEFKIRQPLYNGMTFSDSIGWIYRIEKINDIKEQLDIYCILDNPAKNINHGPSSGEALDSIEIWDNEEQWKINIGTEDGEVLQARAKNNDWMPTRFADKFGYKYSPTDYIPYGFRTNIPELVIGEKAHFQYLVAVDTYDEINIPTWFAVDDTKRNLENYIGIW